MPVPDESDDSAHRLVPGQARWKPEIRLHEEIDGYLAGILGGYDGTQPTATDHRFGKMGRVSREFPD